MTSANIRVRVCDSMRVCALRLFFSRVRVRVRMRETMAKKNLNSPLTVIVEIWYNMRRSHGKGESDVLIAN